ncbi:hypothetical protein ATANTOWER_025069 [Ataeniobius toweri]|uniref:Uncharacterized protein n=1 Tax=Ataeniobius toweri TaxID=208326 RepID=A0ABU7A8S8_9TELE|nr:hypothetical protein [Ataeniobius toweri]
MPIFLGFNGFLSGEKTLRHDPPLEFSSPLRLFGSGGRPSIQAIPPSVPFADLPFMFPSVTGWYLTLIINGKLLNPTNTVRTQPSPGPNIPSNSRVFLCPRRTVTLR